MVTVKDLMEYLSKLDQEMPVYWGIDELPCWLAKADATMADFPVKVDYIKRFPDRGDYFLYFSVDREVADAYNRLLSGG